MRPRPARWIGSLPDLRDCDRSQLVRLCSRCREVVPMHVGALCGGRADRQRAEGCGWRVARQGEGAVEQYERKACNNHMSRAPRPQTPQHVCYTPSPNGDQQPILELSMIAERQFDPTPALRGARRSSCRVPTGRRILSLLPGLSPNMT